MKAPIRYALFALLVAALPPAPAQERTHDITLDDYLSVYLITDVACSRDGGQAVYTELRWGDHDQPRSTDLWFVDAKQRRPLRLTFDPASDHSPQWAPDGQHIYFLTRRNRGDDRPPYDGSSQVWAMTAEPGEPLPITRIKDGVQSFQLSPNGRTLYYARKGAEARQPWKDLRGKYGDIAFGDGPFHYTEIWKLDLQSWREEQVCAPERVITEFQVSPDEKHVALITAPDDRLITKEGQTRVEIYTVGSDEPVLLPDALFRAQAPSPYGWIENLVWAPDRGAVAFTVDFDGYPGELFAAEPGPDGWSVWKLTRENEIHHTGHLEFRPDSRDLCFLAEDHARRRVYCVKDVRAGQQGGTECLTPGDVVVHDYDIGVQPNGDGEQLWIVKADPRSCPDVFRKNASMPVGQFSQLTDQNPQIKTWKLPQITLVKWVASDGTEVEGILELPPDWKRGDEPLPTVVELHGGPTASTLYQMRYWIYGRTLLAAKGYALLSPNYRGSTGYGDKFLTDLIGHENDVEVQDILYGVDMLVARGIADPDRLGVMGWSNGGFLTNALITTTQRFKAASSGAGVVDMFMQWGLEDTPGHVVNFMRGLPWEASSAYLHSSPAYQLGQVTTPTIIHVGAEDTRVPAAHSRALYRALKDYTNVPTVLLVYPGAGHGLTISDHRKGKLEWDLAWFDKYLLGKEGVGE